ncbi:extracellular solute-binding protein [Radiobacillus sp. PE A8.2]|uniref:extracellular solute-binding protein n=1 Tax=Radiobacillus sp. PE A8.2 TaxID=3380349 RepID=UPI00388ED047
MKLKNLMYLLIVVLITIGLVACSSDTSSEDNNNNEPEQSGTEDEGDADTESEETPDASDQKFTITALDFTVSGVAKDGPGVEMINEKFNVDYQVTNTLKNGYDEKITTIFASGEIPDVIGFIGGDAKFTKYAEEGAFLDLTEYIDDYSTFQEVPDPFYQSLSVGGKIYGIPNYVSRYPDSMSIRQDWLDNLGLDMPTNYEELKEVAIAFTKDDPDGNGKDDTTGLLTTVLANNIFPFHAQGPYWDPELYFGETNEDGDVIPNRLGEGWKEVVQLFHDLYQEGALNPDFYSLSLDQANNEFYSGKVGMWVIGTWLGAQDYARTLAEVHPDAKIAPIPPFEDPEGNTGIKMNRGYSSVTALSADLADEPEKVKRILEMINYGRTYFPLEEQTGDNEDFDWLNGEEGQGYDMVDGKAVVKENALEKGLAPAHYLPDATGYLPAGVSTEKYKEFDVPLLKEAVKLTEEMRASYDAYSPRKNLIQSKAETEQGADLRQFIIDEHVKMIVGERPISEWDQVAQEWYDKGGAEIIKEYNEGFAQLEDFESWVKVE